MIDTSVLLPFILSSLVIILSPGADTFLLLRFAIRGGPSAGFAAMAGISARAGLRTLRVPVDSSSAVLQGTDKPLRMSLITNVTNPKVLIFYLAFFPQFLGQAESAVLQLTLLSVAFLVVTIIWLVPLVYAASAARNFFLRPRVAVAMEFTVAGVFLLLAILLAINL